MQVPHRCQLTVVGFLACLSLPATATVVRALSLEEKMHLSPVVVHGEVERVEAVWRVPESIIETLIHVRVRESIKGPNVNERSLVIVQAGGTIGNLTQQIPGQSNYTPQEEVVLFLEPLGARYITIGVGIGKYEVKNVGREKRVFYAPNIAELRLTPSGQSVVAEAVAMEPIALSEFLATLRQFAARSSPGKE